MKKIILFIVLLIALIALSFTSYLYINKPLSRSQFLATVEVTEDIGGFDVNSTALTFGSVAIGGSSTRMLTVTNDYSFPVQVERAVKGSIAEIAYYEPIVILEPYESRSLPMSIVAGINTTLGNYSGMVIVTIRAAQ